MDVKLTKNTELSAAEIEQLEGMKAAEVEQWMQARSRELGELTAATRKVNAQAHEILDRKNAEEHRAAVAARGPNFPPAQIIGQPKQLA